MEALREAVYLRHYAQKNPLLEYKIEGFDIFDEMIDDIRRSIATQALPRPHPDAARSARYGPPRRPARRSHDEIGQFGGRSGGSRQPPPVPPTSALSARGRRPAAMAAGLRGPSSATVVQRPYREGRHGTIPVPAAPGKKYKHSSTAQRLVPCPSTGQRDRPRPLRTRPRRERRYERVVQPSYDTLVLSACTSRAARPSSSFCDGPRRLPPPCAPPCRRPRPRSPCASWSCLRSRVTGRPDRGRWRQLGSRAHRPLGHRRRTRPRSDAARDPALPAVRQAVERARPTSS
ncbi:MAG: hypothetical protein MZU97_08205 [Bacillus subtilis]|nr:hypothetical protein [Bacillus subtilis]